MPALRVAHLVGTAGATGVESFLLALLPAFDRRVVEPTLFVPHEGPLTTAMRAAHVPVELGAPARKLDLGASRRLAPALRERFDLVHAHGSRVSFWAVAAARDAGLPCVVTLHELRWRTLPAGAKRIAWVWLEARAWRRADRLTVVSETMRSELLGRYPSFADRVDVVPGTSPWAATALAGAPASPFVRPGPTRLVTVGRFDRVKGLDRLLRSLARMSDPDWTIDVVGSGPEERAWRALAERLGIATRVRWLGGDAIVTSVLSGSDLFVTATRSEGWPLSLVEAAACGVPVVATAVGGVPEVVIDGTTGVLVAESPESTLADRFAEALARLRADPARAQRLGAAARERARERFGADVLAGGMTAVYARVARDSRA